MQRVGVTLKLRLVSCSFGKINSASKKVETTFTVTIGESSVVSIGSHSSGSIACSYLCFRCPQRT